jgi:hypothetical protein
MIATPTPRIYSQQLFRANDQQVVISATKSYVLTIAIKSIKQPPGGRYIKKAVSHLFRADARFAVTSVARRWQSRSVAFGLVLFAALRYAQR